MNDLNTQQTVQPVEDETKVTLQDIEKKYFPPAQLEAGTDYINAVMEIADAENVEPVFNFNPEETFPEGYGISIVPLTKRVPERGNLTYGVVIAAVPTVELLSSEDAGMNWVEKVVTDSLVKQVSASAKPKEDGAMISIPFKISEFITSARSSGLAAFNLVATDYVKALKTKGLKFMSKALLRQVLASAQFAEQQFPRISQENWQMVLQSMSQHVQAKGAEVGILTHWANTRNETTIDVSEIDLTDLDSMI